MKTISLSGLGAITPNENGNGMLFEFWADDPDGQQVETMKATGTAQLMRSGSFFFVPNKKRVRNNSLLIRKAAHGRLSATKDGATQLTLKSFKVEAINWPRAFVRETVDMMTDIMGAKQMADLLSELLKGLKKENHEG